METKKYVVTGGSGSGLEGIFSRLPDLKYFVIKDVALYALKGKYIEHDIMSDPNRDSIQKEIIDTQLDWESKIPANAGLAFLSSGAFDPIAYYLLRGTPLPKSLVAAAEKAKYDKVFILPPLAHSDGLNGISKALFDVYHLYGYEPAVISSPSVEDRLKQLLEITDPCLHTCTNLKRLQLDAFNANAK